jgi:hypothetical protein
MAAEHEGRVPVDALMAAITGEPVPPGSGTEAERRSAEADVALLREQLGVIGRALAEPPAPEPARAAPVPDPRPRSRRRRLNVVFGALAVACAGMFVAGLGWLAAQGGGVGGANDAAGSKAESSAGKEADAGTLFGSADYLACARVVAEGTVTAAEPVPGEARHRITLDVTRSHKPARSAPEITFVLDDSTARLHPGEHALIGIPRHGAVADTVVTGARAIAAERPRITAALPESRTLTCD